MDRVEFERMKAAGEIVSDADLQKEDKETVYIPDDRHEEGEEEVQKPVIEEDVEELEQEDIEEVEEELSPKEQTAFQKRLEREQTKLREKLEEEFKQKYSKHDEVIQSLGGDADKLLQAAKDAKIAREAQALADRNGWTDEDTQWYIEDQKNKQELKELRVQMQINRLKDTPEYQGIHAMEKEILGIIDKSNGSLDVEQAFWALGGSKKADQIKMEAKQREIAKRAQQPRTVVKDATTIGGKEKPLPPEIVRQAQKMGISIEEAVKIMNGPTPGNIDEYRKAKAK